MELLEENKREEREGEREKETQEEEGGKRMGGPEEEKSVSREEGGGELLGSVGAHSRVVDRKENCTRLTAKAALGSKTHVVCT